MPALLSLNRLILLLLFVPTSLTAATFSVTTMNVESYGLGEGSIARDRTLNAYLDDNHLRSDVMVFQEIVDVDRLKAEIMGGDYQCVSYESPAAKHQHVVVCLKATVRLERASDDDNFILEDIAMGNAMYRPAVHGILRLASDGTPLAHLVGVHLKAMPQDSAKRVRQVQMIHDYLAFDRADDLPAIVVGDANLFGDDIEAVNGLLGDDLLGLKPLETPGKYTFRKGGHGQKFDRFWIGPGLSEQGVARVPGPCNLTGQTATAKIKAYNLDVSDHCAVAMKLKTTTP